MTERMPPASTLARAVAAGAQPPDLLPDMHREVLAATSGARSVVLERAPRESAYRVTSAGEVHDLDGSWATSAETNVLDALAGGEPRLSDLSALPTLATRLQTSRALIVPITPMKRPVLLVVAAPAVDDAGALAAAARARVEFGAAITLSRIAHEGRYHQRVRDLLLTFSRGVTSAVGLGSALEALAHEINALLATRRTSIWLHDRRARELALTASSDRAHMANAARVAADDPRAPAARGLRLDSPQVLLEPTEAIVIAPLRGWRRALGTIVIEGASGASLDDDQMIELAHGLARQLSVTIENVQLLDEILRQRRLLEDTFNSLVDLVVVTDNALRVVQTNEAFAARAGGPRPSLLDRPLDHLVGAEMGAWAARQAGGDDHAARTRQFEDERLGGTFAATIAPLINQEGHPVGRVLVARDITEHTRLEAERATLRERLAQSEKLASLGQFVAGIAHEMNNPLQGVLGHLELLLETSEAARPLRGTLRTIYHEADRAAKIVRNLLVFTGSRRMTRRKVRVDRILSRAIGSRGAATRRAGIQTVREFDKNLPPINADALLLQQAFLNVLINAEHAIAAKGSGGQIEVRTATNDARDRILISIRDTGDGIAADVLPRIFDPFFTTKEVGQGTGLGLAITYGIIQEHGGMIRAANAPEGGAVFTIELPAAKI